MTAKHLAHALEDMPDWARRTVYWAAGALFLAGLGMSAYYLTMLAMWFGVAMPFALLLPFALDAGAIVGVVMWVTGGEGSDVERFGKNLARQMIAASVLGNALDRVLTFSPGAAPASPEQGLAVLLERTQALVQLLTTGELRASAWALLVVSVAIGVVFPILAYRMAHALILVRKAADASRTAPANLRQEQAPAQPQTVAQEVERREELADAPEPEQEPEPTPEETTGPIPTVAGYVHDPRDLEPHSPEWQERFDLLPGGSKRAKLEYWLEHAWALGHEPVLSTEADRVVDGNRTAQDVKGRLARRGIFPPSERQAAEPKVLTHA